MVQRGRPPKIRVAAEVVKVDVGSEKSMIQDEGLDEERNLIDVMVADGQIELGHELDLVPIANVGVEGKSDTAKPFLDAAQRGCSREEEEGFWKDLAGNRDEERGEPGASSAQAGSVFSGGGRVEAASRKGGGPMAKGKQVADERWVPAKRGARVDGSKEMGRGTDISVPSQFQQL
ncbi:hypothetical protein Dimus_002042 [Dionaea muscipula]